MVSQFTLYGNTDKGRRPSWIDAARPEHAEPLVEAVVERLRSLGATVATGRFRTEMQVELVNDGPVTPDARARDTIGCDAPRAPDGSTARSASGSSAAARPWPVAEAHVPGAAAAQRHVHRDHALLADLGALVHAAAGSTKAEKPVGDTCTTQRPVSMARSLLDATCWVCSTVPV